MTSSTIIVVDRMTLLTRLEVFLGKPYCYCYHQVEAFVFRFTCFLLHGLCTAFAAPFTHPSTSTCNDIILHFPCFAGSYTKVDGLDGPKGNNLNANQIAAGQEGRSSVAAVKSRCGHPVAAKANESS